MKSKNTCSHCHKDLDGDGPTLWLDNERRLQSAPLGDPPDHRIEALSSPVPVCTACNDSYQAIRKIEKAMKKDRATRHQTNRRTPVRALDHHCQLLMIRPSIAAWRSMYTTQALRTAAGDSAIFPRKTRSGSNTTNPCCSRGRDSSGASHR